MTGYSNIVNNPSTSISTVNKGKAGRPTLMFFGNSVAAQNNRFLGSNTTTCYMTPSAPTAGSTKIAVTATAGFIQAPGALVVGAEYKIMTVGSTDFTALGAADNNVGTVFVASGVGTTDATAAAIYTNIAIMQPSGGYHKCKIIAIASGTPGTIYIDTPLPRTISSVAGQNLILKYSGYPLMSITYGPFASAIAQLGHPVEILGGFGFLGAVQNDMLPELARFLKYYQPTYTVLQLLENDVNSATPLPAKELNRLLASAVTMCINADSIPIVTTCVPRSTITAGAKANLWDASYAYAMGLTGCIVIDWSTPWLDTTQPTVRVPLANWTDGTHPAQAYYNTIGSKYTKPYIANIFGKRSTHADFALFLTDMSGSVAIVDGTGRTTGVMSSGVSLYCSTGCATVGSKTANDDLDIVFSNSSPVVVSTAITLVTTSYTTAANVALGGQWVKSFVRLKVISAINVGNFQLTAVNADGLSQVYHTANASLTDYGIDAALIGQEITLETAPYKLQNQLVNVKTQLDIRPHSTAAMSGEVVVLEMGIIPATQEISWENTQL